MSVGVGPEGEHRTAVHEAVVVILSGGPCRKRRVLAGLGASGGVPLSRSGGATQPR